MRSRIILLVDDDADSLQVLARLCEMDGHDVRTAGTMHDALAAHATRPCELLVTDLGLPDGTGMELARQLCERSGTPAVALTGYEPSDEWSADGFASYLIKPVVYEKLRAAIASACGPCGDRTLR